MSNEKYQPLTEYLDCEFHCKTKDIDSIPSKEDEEAAEMYLENFMTSSKDVKSFLKKGISAWIF